VTWAAYGRVTDAPSKPDIRNALAIAAAVFLMLIYSQAWVFPLMGEKANEAAAGLIRALYIPAYAAGVFLLALTPLATLKAAMRQPFLILLLLIAGASYFWSISPDQTTRRLVALYATTLGGVVIGARWTWAALSEVMATCFAVLAALTLAVCLAMPDVGRMPDLFPGAWRGLWTEKNALGGNMTIGFVLLMSAAVLNPRRRWLWGGFAVVALFLVIMSTSKTSLVSLILGFGGLVIVAMARRSPAMSIATTWLVVLGIGLMAAVAIFASDAVLDILGKDATLTGRTKIWAAAMRQIELNPMTGYGYGAVWDEKGVWGPLAWIVKDAGFKPQHAHNAWIEQWLGQGIFGLAAFSLFYAQTLGAAVAAVFRDRGAYLAVPFLVVYTLMTLTESVAVTYNDLRWVLFTAIAVKLAWPDRKIAA
jgi:O-antigen ligase